MQGSASSSANATMIGVGCIVRPGVMLGCKLKDMAVPPMPRSGNMRVRIRDGSAPPLSH
jgi:hypothetical protein